MSNDSETTAQGALLPVLTKESLLELCTLDEMTSSKEERLECLHHWYQAQPVLLQTLVVTASDKKSGCFPLHWAAGTGFDEAVRFLLDTFSSSKVVRTSDTESTTTTTTNICTFSANQLAVKPSTGRTPLHYAARNGHLSVCILLTRDYHADAGAKCHCGGVTPLQLSVWQNRLSVVKYLVRVNPPGAVLETNQFRCGLNHWIGLVPKHRWLSNDGSGVLPLAHFLAEQGVSYTSDNIQNQGHTPLHKAAWGGNIALMKYYQHEFDVYDTVQDACGNYAADLAQMAKETKAREWLYQHGSRERQKSCAVLSLDATATHEEIQARYKALAKQHHPDKQFQHNNMHTRDDDNEAFLKIKTAYEHLIYKGGVGSQRNPKFEALRLLTASTESSTCPVNTCTIEDDGHDDDLFQARLLVILSDYGDKGFPISSVAKRWNQIWPDRPFPTPGEYLINTKTSTDSNTKIMQKKVKLLKFLKWKCRGVVSFRKVNGVELAFQKDVRAA
jgi:hypothetical protein